MTIKGKREDSMHNPTDIYHQTHSNLISKACFIYSTNCNYREKSLLFAQVNFLNGTKKVIVNRQLFINEEKVGKTVYLSIGNVWFGRYIGNHVPRLLT